MEESENKKQTLFQNKQHTNRQKYQVPILGYLDHRDLRKRESKIRGEVSIEQKR